MFFRIKVNLITKKAEEQVKQVNIIRQGQYLLRSNLKKVKRGKWSLFFHGICRIILMRILKIMDTITRIISAALLILPNMLLIITVTS